MAWIKFSLARRQLIWLTRLNRPPAHTRRNMAQALKDHIILIDQYDIPTPLHRLDNQLTAKIAIVITIFSNDLVVTLIALVTVIRRIAQERPFRYTKQNYTF